MDIIAHTMEYAGGPVDQDAGLMPYSDGFFEEYERLYNDSFRDMRTALGLEPVNCCGSRGAVKLYLSGGFRIRETEIIRRT